MKKIIALVLALVMVLSLGTVAFAKEGYYQDLDKATRFFNNVVSRSIANMLYQPVKAAVEAVNEAIDYGAETVAEEVDKVANEVNAAATEMQTAVNNTEMMAYGLIWTVKTVYQAGGYALRFAGEIFGFDDDTAFFTGDNTIDAWLARCIENAGKYAEMANGTVWNVADKVDEVLENVINETALDDDPDTYEAATVIGTDVEKKIKDLENFTNGYLENFVKGTSRFINNYLNNLFKIPVTQDNV